MKKESFLFYFIYVGLFVLICFAVSKTEGIQIMGLFWKRCVEIFPLQKLIHRRNNLLIRCLV